MIDFNFRLVQQIRLSQIHEISSRRLRVFNNHLKLNPLFKRFSDLCSSADHVKRVLVINVFIRRFFPAKFVSVYVMDQLHHRDSDRPGFEQLPVKHVNLHSTATDARVFLKCRLKYTTPEEHSSKTKIIQTLSIRIRIDVGRANQLEWSRRSASF